MFVDFNILNQLGSPSINSNTFANRPAAGQTGRLFVSTDTFEIYRDNGTGWDLIGGPGAGTITGTGTATQVAYFTGAQTIGSSANLFWDNTAGALGINTATPSAELDVHGTGIIAQLNSTSATANSLLAFQRSGSGVWRIGDQYNGGSNFFELHNTVLTNNAIAVTAANNKSTFTALETYASGLATGNQFTYNLTVPNGVNITSPNAVHAVNSYLNLSLGGNTTVPVGARQGLEGNSRISFTGAGTLTMTQGSTVRAFSALSSVYSFAGNAVGTVTHLAGLRICFPDNIGSAINITNNYGLLLNDQTAGLGTVTYTNRWGIYQEGASDLNYFNGNLLVKTTTNAGFALDINGTGRTQQLHTFLQGTFINATGTSYYYSVDSGGSSLGGLQLNNQTQNYTGYVYTGRSGSANSIAFFHTTYNGSIPSSHTPSQKFTDTSVTFGATSKACSLQVILGGGAAGTYQTPIFIYNNVNTTNTGVGLLFQAADQTGQGQISEGLLVTYKQNLGGGFITSSMRFHTISDAANTLSEKMRITDAANVLINTTTDAGFRLDCNGTARVQGATTITGAITATANGHRFGNLEVLTTGSASATGQGITITGADQTFQLQGSGNPESMFVFRNWSSLSATGSLNNISKSVVRFYGGFTDGNLNNLSGNQLWLSPTYNFAGTRTGIIVRGIYYNPTLTSLTNTTHRAIETETGDVILGSTSGSTSVGATTTINASAQLQVVSTTKGFLPPVMTGAQAEAIGTPAAGLMVYANNGNGVTITTTGWWGYDGATWVKLN